MRGNVHTDTLTFVHFALRQLPYFIYLVSLYFCAFYVCADQSMGGIDKTEGLSRHVESVEEEAKMAKARPSLFNSALFPPNGSSSVAITPKDL